MVHTMVDVRLRTIVPTSHETDVSKIGAQSNVARSASTTRQKREGELSHTMRRVGLSRV